MRTHVNTHSEKVILSLSFSHTQTYTSKWNHAHAHSQTHAIGRKKKCTETQMHTHTQMMMAQALQETRESWCLKNSCRSCLQQVPPARLLSAAVPRTGEKLRDIDHQIIVTWLGGIYWQWSKNRRPRVLLLWIIVWISRPDFNPWVRFFRGSKTKTAFPSII